jgi:hypothetical protein
MDAPGKHDGPRRSDRLEPVTSTLRCPLCQDPVRLEVPTPWVACAACLARHHGSCWADVRQCGACGHAVRLWPDDRRRPWLRLLASAVLSALLTAVALKAALFRERIRITIDSPDGSGGMTGEVDDITDGIAAPDDAVPRSDGGTTSGGYRLTGDRTMVDDGSGTWVPYNPMVHGDLPTD